MNQKGQNSATLHRYHRAGRPLLCLARHNWIMGLFFCIGSLLFMLGCVLALFPSLTRRLPNWTANVTFFTDSILFPTAAYLQLFQAASAAFMIAYVLRARTRNGRSMPLTPISGRGLLLLYGGRAEHGGGAPRGALKNGAVCDETDRRKGAIITSIETDQRRGCAGCAMPRQPRATVYSDSATKHAITLI